MKRPSKKKQRNHQVNNNTQLGNRKALLHAKSISAEKIEQTRLGEARDFELEREALREIMDAVLKLQTYVAMRERYR